jgi:hypothetical protein
MNKKIISDLIDIKHEMINEVSQHLSPETGEKIKRLEYEFMTALNEATKEYLEKTEKPKKSQEEHEKVKKVTVE